MQIVWNGDNYHADCIGQAVALKQAEADRVSSSRAAGNFSSGDNNQADESFDESFEDEFNDDANENDFDEQADRFGEMPDVSDEILNQIPVSAGNGGHRRNVIVPEVIEPARREVHINDVAANAAHQFAQERAGREGNGKVGTLIAGRETTLINRSALRHLPVPEATATFQPIPHHELINRILECLSYRRLSVVREEYAVSPDGMKLFGLMELNVEYSGVRFAIGMRNSNDKSMRIGLVAGYRVMVCENKMLTGDFNPLLAKHSKNFNLLDALSVGIDRIQRNIGKVEENIEFKKNYQLDEETAKNMIYRAFLIDKFPMSLMRSVHHEFFVAPGYEEFKPRNLWSLENSFTSVFKRLKPVAQFEATAKLGKFLTAYN
jgi:hypothetical protein